MGYAIGNEFPNYCGKYPSIGELLELYYKLTSNYQQLLQDINDTNTKLDNYMSNIDSMIPGWIDAATKEQQDKLNKLAEDLKNQMDAQSTAINALISAYDARLDTQFKNQMARVQTLLNQTTTWCTNQINEMKIWVRHEEEQMKRWIDKRVEQLGTRQDMLDAILQALSSRVGSIESEFEELVKDINRRLATHAQELRLWYYQQMAIDRKWVKDTVDELTDRVNALPKSTLPVDNYFIDEQSTLQEWIDDLWNKVLPYHGFTAMEWANRTDITCAVWQLADISALSFYTHGTEILQPMIRTNDTMVSPVTGRIVPVWVAVNEVFNALNPTGIKAAEYDNWNMDAAHYDAQNITGKRYLEKDFQTNFD